ncbi:ABC transporter substrate-binding protein [Microbacterium sp. PAMC22086]|uniref:ABC transporter substrate-binding protein n=1 Tax=Microbacterium sp. PAMC22086 TaxID=2861281 RepID=UPI001C626513|nr:extracellular solute-binding protein [Microbacterium sp. PAMC22086]QYG13159.1 extracellular solute-binding protein [Microbacterium sp. PAMC22086]
MGKKTVAVAAITAATLMLGACSSGTAPDESSENPGADLRAGEAYDPRAFEGESINLLLIEHPFVESLRPLIPAFEEETGIKVNLEVLNEQQGFDKLQADLSAGVGNYDLFMTDPLHNWQYSAAGWIEPLDGYVGNDAITMPGYNLDDFAPGVLNAGRWNRELLSGLGEGSLWALPINFESYNLTYRPSLLEAAGVEAPETYEDVLSVTKKLAPALSGNDYPIVTRFDKYWDLTYLTFGSMAEAYGVHLLDDEGKIDIASDASIEATELFIDIVKAGSPEDASAFTWYEVLQGMASGRFALALNEADLFAATYENPEESEISDDVAYAMIPEGPEGRAASAWIWQLSMAAASAEKGAAWTFLQWLTSADVLLQTHLAGNMNPVRLSAWDDPELAALVDTWGAEPGQYREVLEGTAEIAAINFPPHPELTRALDRWAEAIQQTFFDGKAKENLEAAAADIERILLP